MSLDVNALNKLLDVLQHTNEVSPFLNYHFTSNKFILIQNSTSISFQSEETVQIVKEIPNHFRPRLNSSVKSLTSLDNRKYSFRQSKQKSHSIPNVKNVECTSTPKISTKPRSSTPVHREPTMLVDDKFFKTFLLNYVNFVLIPFFCDFKIS